MLLASGDFHLAESCFDSFDDISHDIVLDVRYLVVVNVPPNVVLFIVDGLVGDARVYRVQFETESL